MSLVYLAGPITGLSYAGAVTWRDMARVELEAAGITALSPMRGKDYLAQETSIDDCYDETLLSSQKAITARDRWDCTRSDMVLVNVVGAKRPSLGTVMELGWADAARIPIVLVMESGNIHDHAMVREVSSYIVADLAQGLHVVRALLG